MLGVFPDTEIATAVGVAPATVVSWRRHLDIPKPPRKRRNPEIQYPGISTRLHTASDTHIAAEYGISRERVRQIRGRMGIPRIKPKIELPPDAYILLGRTPDAHIAKFFDIAPWFVRRERIRANIPAATPIDFYGHVIGKVRDRVGVDSDRAIAQDLNIPIAQVVAYRRRHGIPPAVLSPRCGGFVPIDRAHITRKFHEGASDSQIAEEIGSSAASISRIRSQELRLLRQNRVDIDAIAAIHRRLDSGDTPWHIARAFGMNPSTVASIARRYRGKK